MEQSDQRITLAFDCESIESVAFKKKSFPQASLKGKGRKF